MVYLDNASTTYVYPEVADEIYKIIMEDWGNPMNLYTFGLLAKERVENAREKIAKCIGADKDEVFFTSCASESNAFAINNFAVCVCSPYEHHDIKDNSRTRIEPADYLQKINKWGFKPEGEVLYAHMWVNNETGEIFPIKEIVSLAHELNMPILVDATQALGNVDIDVHDIGMDFASFSFHKVHAPKGIGAIYIKRDIQHKYKLKALIPGSQENNLRGGTSNVPYIVGAALATERALEERVEKNLHCEYLRQLLLDKLTETNIPFIINEGKENLPSILNIAFKKITGESLVLGLDARSICISTGSACNSGDLRPSEVLTAMGVPDEWINGAIRISMSLVNTEEDIEALVKGIEWYYKGMVGNV